MREKLQQFVITCRFLPLNFFSCLISLNDIENLWTWTESSFYYIEYIYLWTYVSFPIVIFGSLEVHNIIPSALLLCIFCFFVVLVLHYGSNSFYLPVLPFELQERRTSLQSFPVIICDQFAGFNLTFRMTKGGFLEVLFALLYIYYGALVTVMDLCCLLFARQSALIWNFSLFQLRNEAALTLTGIDKCRDGGFDEVFMTKVDFPAKYDYCIRFVLFR